jgi:hypothetical protein
MIRYKIPAVVVAFFFWGLLSLKTCSACTLGLHEWELAFYQKIQMSSPVLPIMELDIPIRRMTHSGSEIFWVIDRQWYNYFQVLIFPMFYQILTKIPDASGLFNSEVSSKAESVTWPMQAVWYLFPKGDSIGELAFKRARNLSYPMIIGSDKNFFRIALFKDTNSFGHLCYQLVLLQEGRVRAIHANPDDPWAQEFNARAYISVTFFQYPLPGRILNISAYPVNSGVVALYEDIETTARLLDNKLILPRPASDSDPKSMEIPEMPE